MEVGNSNSNLTYVEWVTSNQSDPNYQTRRGFCKVKLLYIIYYALKANMISRVPVG